MYIVFTYLHSSQTMQITFACLIILIWRKKKKKNCGKVEPRVVHVVCLFSMSEQSEYFFNLTKFRKSLEILALVYCDTLYINQFLA